MNANGPFKTWQQIQRDIINERQLIYSKYNTSSEIELKKRMTEEESVRFAQLEVDLKQLVRVSQ